MRRTPPPRLTNVFLGLIALGLIGGAGAAYLFRRCRRRSASDPPERDIVDIASEDSFPASDAPAYGAYPAN